MHFESDISSGRPALLILFTIYYCTYFEGGWRLRVLSQDSPSNRRGYKKTEAEEEAEDDIKKTI